MKTTRNILMMLLLIVVVIVLAIIALYENNILETGIFESNSEGEFIALTIMEFLTIVSLPLALRLFYTKKVKALLVEGKETALLRWGAIRLSLISLPLIANTLLYYLYAFSTSFAYMALAQFVCLVFVLPTKSRCEDDITEK